MVNVGYRIEALIYAGVTLLVGGGFARQWWAFRHGTLMSEINLGFLKWGSAATVAVRAIDPTGALGVWPIGVVVLLSNIITTCLLAVYGHMIVSACFLLYQNVVVRLRDPKFRSKGIIKMRWRLRVLEAIVFTAAVGLGVAAILDNRAIYHGVWLYFVAATLLALNFFAAKASNWLRERLRKYFAAKIADRDALEERVDAEITRFSIVKYLMFVVSGVFIVGLVLIGMTLVSDLDEKLPERSDTDSYNLNLFAWAMVQQGLLALTLFLGWASRTDGYDVDEDLREQLRLDPDRFVVYHGQNTASSASALSLHASSEKESTAPAAAASSQPQA